MSFAMDVSAERGREESGGVGRARDMLRGVRVDRGSGLGV